MIFFLIIWSITTLGCFSLASSMSKHQKQIFGHELNVNQTRLVTIIGWILLIVSLFFSVLPTALSTGMSYWVGVLTFAALFVGLSLSYYAHKIKLIALVVLIIMILSGLLYLF
ncbi:hypothetical protein B9T31_02840 [Acinetobacter sp. ANC 4558]|uniref:DUF3325 domain-containing protein n=1 Tax=Acinetobacter sp. ANC 4558 TaxID=1977876 RepID=UPI000A32C591|nr:DUF3325 domain-containing protein [Acinetobacter sp. ANC 4558]OTG87457.1 hypothetical protein B9T31_02840 [Acinetobacter sp. ANC 4558]